MCLSLLITSITFGRVFLFHNKLDVKKVALATFFCVHCVGVCGFVFLFSILGSCVFLGMVFVCLIFDWRLFLNSDSIFLKSSIIWGVAL